MSIAFAFTDDLLHIDYPEYGNKYFDVASGDLSTPGIQGRR
jgi:hypothetical protein